MHDNNGSEYLKGLILGGLIGSVLGILFAPKSGKETREELNKRADALIAKAKDEYDQAIEKTKKAYETSVEKLKELETTAKKKVAEVEEKVGELTDKSKESVVEQKSRLKKAIDAGVDTYKDVKGSKKKA
jgi:gas vesicle protein